jgi:hypothetical protein
VKQVVEWTPQLVAWLQQYNEALERKPQTQETDMGRYATDKGGGTDFKQAPAGTHIARCYSIVDIGTQHGEYLGEPTAREQIIIRWELPFETEEFDGQQKPLIVSKFYTNSLSEKANLRKDLENWRSRAFTEAELAKFDLESILGKPCTVSVVHNDKGKAKVTGVGAVPKGTTCPPLYNKPSAFWIEQYDDNAFMALPKGFQDLISKSDEFKAAFAPPPPKKGEADESDLAQEQASRDADDDITF